MSRLLTYPDEAGDRTLITCRCGQAARVQRRGGRLDVRCFGGCASDDVLAGIDQQRVLSELDVAWTIREGKAVRMQSYWERPDALEAAGLSE